MARATLQDIVERLFGVATTTYRNRELTSVGTSVVTILRNDPNRLAATIVNLSNSAVYVLDARTVSATNGIRISPGGGTATLIYDEDFHSTGWEWFAIADAAASAVLVREVVAR